MPPSSSNNRPSSSSSSSNNKSQRPSSSSSSETKDNSSSSNTTNWGRPGYLYPGTDIIQTTHHSNQDKYGSTQEPKAAKQYREMPSPPRKPAGKLIEGTDLVQTDFPSYQTTKGQGGGNGQGARS